jgi:dipeptidyl aminopeptidase/acylaminoacyl peptidase
MSETWRRVVWIALLVTLVALSVFWLTRDLLSGSDEADGPAPAAVLAYASNGDIFFVRRGQAEPEQLTVTSEEERSPALSPDGTTVVFERIEGPDSATRWGLHAMSIDGGPATRLTTGARESGYDRYPAWSPDGERIAFVRHLAKGSEIVGTDAAIVVMNADGSGQREVTGRPGVAAHPVWSHDGDVVFYDTVRGETPWVARLEVDTGDQELLVRGFHPQPSGDDGVAFLRTIRPFVVDAFEISPVAGEAHRLTRGRRLWALVSSGRDGLAAAEGETRGDAGAPRSRSTIVVLRGRAPGKDASTASSGSAGSRSPGSALSRRPPG